MTKEKTKNIDFLHVGNIATKKNREEKRTSTLVEHFSSYRKKPAKKLKFKIESFRDNKIRVQFDQSIPTHHPAINK